jgi:hypothetical protein
MGAQLFVSSSNFVFFVLGASLPLQLDNPLEQMDNFIFHGQLGLDILTFD